MAKNKLVIVYEGPCGGQGQESYDSPPVFYNDDDYIIFAKGVLVDRKVEYTRILEVYVTQIVYNAYDEGLKALEEVDAS
jgi:hypothetical protein